MQDLLELEESLESESVPIRKEEWEKIHEAIEIAIDKAIAPLRPRGWRRALYLLREWGILAANATVIVALLAFAATQLYSATQRVAAEKVFEANTTRDLTEIKGQLARMSLTSHAALPLADFKTVVPDLASSIATLQIQKTKIPLNVVDSLSKKLTDTEPTTQGYWPAVAELISYRSSLLQNRQDTINLPLCPANNPHLAFKGFVFYDCILDIDGRQIQDDRCIRCIVRYSGGPVSIQNLQLVDSLLIFKANGNSAPEGNGQKLEQILLASDLRDVTITGLS